MTMNLTSRIALALLAIGSVHQAQQPAKNPDQPQTIEAAAAVEPDVPLRFQVTGLTKENALAIKTALTELSVQAYVCEPCKVEQALSGQCSKCSAALVTAKKPLLVSVAPSPEESSLALMLNPRRAVKLSEVEAVLKKSSITIDHAKLPLPGRIILVAKGATADRLAAVEKALVEAKLFDEVKATFEAATSELRFTVRSKASPPTRAQAAKVLEAQQLQLVDVLFGHG